MAMTVIIHHHAKLEMEIAYLGILDEYYGKKLGGYLLSEAIKTIVWVPLVSCSKPVDCLSTLRISPGR